MTEVVDWYDYPRYFEMAFADETKLEADFIEAACAKFAARPVRTLLEPGCGGGRLQIELAARGYRTTGFDNNPRMLEYLQSRAQRRRLPIKTYAADLAAFRVPQPVDAAFCTFNTFRHLLTEDAALEHLRCAARAVRRGGLFILGLHLLPPDASEECIERWTAGRGSTHVHFTLRVVESSRRLRRERIRVSLLARQSGRQRRLATEFQLRLYNASQIRSLLAKVPEFEHCATYDFNYEIDLPLKLDDQLSDAVFVLRRR